MSHPSHLIKHLKKMSKSFMVDNDSSSSVQLHVLLTKISFPRKNYSHFPADSIFVLRGKVSN